LACRGSCRVECGTLDICLRNGLSEPLEIRSFCSHQLCRLAFARSTPALVKKKLRPLDDLRDSDLGDLLRANIFRVAALFAGFEFDKTKWGLGLVVDYVLGRYLNLNCAALGPYSSSNSCREFRHPRR
jgi:hypothetical protein